MATKINLLPVELGAGKEALKVSEVLNRVSVVTGVIFLVAGVLGLVYLFVNQRQVSNQTIKNNQLETSIRNLQATEQKLVLIKDRVNKIRNLFSQKSAYDNSGNLAQIFSGLPQDVFLNEANITSSQVSFSVTSRSSLGMVAFLNNLATTQKFKQMVLKNFNFRPSSGYAITIEAN